MLNVMVSPVHLSVCLLTFGSKFLYLVFVEIQVIFLSIFHHNDDDSYSENFLFNNYF